MLLVTIAVLKLLACVALLLWCAVALAGTHDLAKRGLFGLLLVLLAAPALAQELPSHPIPHVTQLTLPPAPEFGMSRWATWVNYAGPIANVATQELAFAKFGVYDKAVKQRVVVGGLSLGMAALNHWLSRWMPRANANGQAVVMAAWGAFDAGRNIHVMVTVRR